MDSQHYCPKCKSFDIKRVKRGFIAKKILHSSPQYHCEACGYRFSKADMLKNPYQPDARIFEDSPTFKAKVRTR